MSGRQFSTRRRTGSGTNRPWLAAALLLVAPLLFDGCRPGTTPASAPAESGSDSKAELVPYRGTEALKMNPEGLKLAGITTYSAMRQALGQALQLPGQIVANDGDAVQVTARLPGKITRTMVSVGSPVRAGQIVATVNSVDLAQAEATYRTALAHEDLTRNQLAQQRSLAGYGMFSEQPIEDARRAFSAAEAAVASDRAQLSLDRIALVNTEQLVKMGETTHKPVEDAQNAYAQAQTALAQARTAFNSAKSNLDRTKVLYKGGVYALQQLEDSQAAYDSATASVAQDSTQEQLAKSELTRQQEIYRQNLNGASALQGAQSKLQQDQHTYQNDLTSLSLARRALSRARSVHGSNIPTTQALQQARDAYDEAHIALTGAQETLRLYGVTPGQAMSRQARGDVVIPVTSPISGIVTSRTMAVGQMVDATTPLVKVLNLGRVYVDAQVFEQELPNVSVGDPMTLQVAAYPDRRFAGRVSVVGKEVSPDTRTVLVRSEIQNPGSVLRPGMFATVTLGSRRRRIGLAIPAIAVLQDASRSIVFVRAGTGLFVKTPVKVGVAVNGLAPVLSGLSDGDAIVVAGAPLLQAEQERLESEKGNGA